MRAAERIRLILYFKKISEFLVKFNKLDISSHAFFFATIFNTILSIQLIFDSLFYISNYILLFLSERYFLFIIHLVSIRLSMDQTDYNQISA